MKANRRPVDPDDSAEAGLQLPVAESLPVKIYLLMAILTLCVYIGFRLWDVIVNIHNKVRPTAQHAPRTVRVSSTTLTSHHDIPARRLLVLKRSLRCRFPVCEPGIALPCRPVPNNCTFKA